MFILTVENKILYDTQILIKHGKLYLIYYIFKGFTESILRLCYSQYAISFSIQELLKPKYTKILED